jgi:chromosome segregation ATPase
MSDNPTRETHDSRSFEERVFARFDSLDGRLTALEEKVDSRLRETRPIWEAVQTRLENMETRLENVETHLGNVENELGEVKKEVKSLGRGVMLLHEDNLHIRTDQREFRERIEKLESQHTP